MDNSFEFPAIVRFKEDDGCRPNFTLQYNGNNEYWKHHGGWGVSVVLKEGKIICQPTCSNTEHLRGKELVPCTPEEVERDREFILPVTATHCPVCRAKYTWNTVHTTDCTEIPY